MFLVMHFLVLFLSFFLSLCRKPFLSLQRKQLTNSMFSHCEQSLLKTKPNSELILRPPLMSKNTSVDHIFAWSDMSHHYNGHRHWNSFQVNLTCNILLLKILIREPNEYSSTAEKSPTNATHSPENLHLNPVSRCKITKTCCGKFLKCVINTQWQNSIKSLFFSSYKT